MGKVAVITGGSSGIGLALAKHLVKEHFSLAVLARDQKRLADAEKELSAIAPADVSIKTFSVDVAHEESVIRTMNEILNIYGKIDWLITSAGFNTPGYFEDQTPEIFRKTFDVNFYGTLHCIRHVLPHMKRRKQGNIVIISSGAGLVGIFGSSAYSSSKFALSGLAETLRSECVAYNVKVSIAYPPDTDTPLLQRNEALKPWETLIIMEQGGKFSPEKVASKIYKGVSTKSYAISIGNQLRFVNRFKSLIYPYIFRTFDKKLEKGRKKR